MSSHGQHVQIVVDLPSDPSSDAEAPSLPSDASSQPDLPPDVGPETTPLATQGSCCQNGCLTLLSETGALQKQVDELSKCLQNLTSDEAKQLRFQCLSQWQQQSTGWRRWKVFGQTYLCKEAVRQVLGVSHRAINSFLKQAQEGKLRADNKLQHTQSQRVASAAVVANSMLQWVYENIAESFAEGSRWLGEDVTRTNSTSASSGSRSLPSLTDVIAGRVTSDRDDCKWLHPGTTLAELKELAESFLECRCSYSTFVSCYHQNWWRKLKVRAEGHHSKCMICERLKEFRRQVVSSADQALVKSELEQHRKAVMCDREVDHWLQCMSKLACGIAPGVPQSSLLSICIDAMDAAKFRCPRNVSASKEFQGLWRPEIHLLGAVSPVCEHYFLCDADLKKDASMQVTVLSSALDITYRKLAARGRDMPTELRVHTDNATAEGKNQTMLKFAAWLVNKGHFDQVSLTQFRVGHSHGLNDQRFSECREVLSASPVLEEPAAYQEVLQKGMAAREKRDLDVQLLHATADWKRFFELLELNVSGHTQTHQKKVAGKDAVHFFVLTTRGRLEEDGMESNLQEFPGSVERHDRDIVMTCYMYLLEFGCSKPRAVCVCASFFVRAATRATNVSGASQ